ncbi:hypothetical protein MGG_03767 [Pyricularia oryzae 70-15]|uniref:Uncharacterized protein n=1 Tax=Pyricularia oryzae (strain 70-15 / ATCC MYA-4617 / FGSC 8958) TaxID=242507 RepID=G4NHP4_PYRO7|nr:uncharacterized protein MGG_03767 [Pyricularia oryzae 70-15]EHA47754.1 hypothetical protein MGG_03767 [Pyricularia oryzae 70-15]
MLTDSIPPVYFARGILTPVTTSSPTPNSLTQCRTVTNTGWVSAPPGRGTSGILWICFSVILLCSYKCIHLDIPSQAEIQAEFPKWDRFRNILRKVWWMLVMCIVPAVPLFIALLEYSKACVELKKVQYAQAEFASWFQSTSWKGVQKPTITMSHAFYANMGGIVPIFSSERQRPAEMMEISSDNQVNPEAFSTQNLMVDQESGPAVKHETRTKPFSLCEYIEFLRSLETDEQRAPFLLTEADIAGFAKSDPIAKLVAISQILYLGVTCFARLSHKVPISLLELMTTTYILVSALMYYFWWHKPYDARYVTVLFSPGSVSRSVECGPSGELPFQHDQPGFNAALNRHGQHFALNEQLTSGDGNPKRVKKGTFQYHDLLHLEKENVSMVLIYVCCLTLSASNGFLALPWAWTVGSSHGQF